MLRRELFGFPRRQPRRPLLWDTVSAVDPLPPCGGAWRAALGARCAPVTSSLMPRDIAGGEST